MTQNQSTIVKLKENETCHIEAASTKHKIDTIYMLISNIPAKFRSSDLRFHFSDFIELGGFRCFHFRHRPDPVSDNESTEGRCSAVPSSSSFEQPRLQNALSNYSFLSTAGSENNLACKSDARETCSTLKDSVRKKCRTCCIISIDTNKVTELMNRYDGKNWKEADGLSMKSVCRISMITVSEKNKDNSSEISGKFLTRAEKKSHLTNIASLTPTDLENLPELHPPSVMPQGNVGTPTKHFLRLIQRCRLPPPIIAKLGLIFPRSRSNKRYGAVSLDYDAVFDSENSPSRARFGGNSLSITQPDENSSLNKTIFNKNLNERRAELSSNPSSKNYKLLQQNSALAPSGSLKNTKCFQRSNQSRSQIKKGRSCSRESGEEEGTGGSDSDDCEDWERYESLHDDPSNRERNKERKYEEDMEVVWEKGGPGLVWYTDTQYWDQAEGDEEEKDVDDWDVDCNVYHDPTYGGDKDSTDFVTMLRDSKRRAGFDCDIETSGRRIRKRRNSSPSVREDRVDHYSKGVGRRVMMKQGWREGQSLGLSVKGITEALEGEGQAPSDRKGLGYRGEKILSLISSQAGSYASDKLDQYQPITNQSVMATQLHRPIRNLADSVTQLNRSITRPIISTVYDDVDITDPPEELLRRQESHHIKHRQGSMNFVKSSSS